MAIFKPTIGELHTAMPLCCAFGRNTGVETASFVPLSKIAPTELSAFIQAEVKKEDQLEKRIEFLLLTIPYTDLEEMVKQGSLDTNLFSVSQKAVYIL